MKTFVLDTNILLHDPISIFSFGANEVIIPAIVLEELDTKKKEQNEIGKNARTVTNFIVNSRKGHEGKLSTGIPLDNGGTLRIELNHISFDKLKDVFGEETNDNRILAVAINLRDEFEQTLTADIKEELKKCLHDAHANVITFEDYWKRYYDLTGRLFTVISNDNLVVVKADTLGIKVEQYEKDRIKNLDAIHRGYHKLQVPTEMINQLYENGEVNFSDLEIYIREQMDLGESEDLSNIIFSQDFILLTDLFGSNHSGLGRVIRLGNSAKLVTLILDEEERIANKKKLEPPTIWGIKPKNIEQRMFLELLLDPNVSLICGIGPAGTGKTLLALAAALQQTEEDKLYKKILVGRPVIPMGKDLGYLPGDKNEKMRPWMQPIYDNLEFLLGLEDKEFADGEGKRKRTVDEEIQNFKIEVEALSYIRGRTIPNQIMIFDEFQNCSPAEAKSIITRAGEGTKIILLGDPEQIDHPYLDATNNGLIYAADRMKQESDVGIIRLGKTERSKMAEKAARLL